MQKFLLFFSFAACVFINACTYDNVPQEDIECNTSITYETGPKDIINKSCAYAGCHIAGNSSGDFTSFATMKSRLDNGAFEEWVIEDRRMPPLDAPQGKPKSLTEEEILIFKCWQSQGFNEK